VYLRALCPAHSLLLLPSIVTTRPWETGILSEIGILQQL